MPFLKFNIEIICEKIKKQGIKTDLKRLLVIIIKA